MVKLHPDVGVADVSSCIDCEGTHLSLGDANFCGCINGNGQGSK